MRYFLDRDQERPEWIVYVAPEPGVGGTVILTLPGSLPRADAERTRRALASARGEGRREVADEISSLARRLRLAEG